MPSPATETTAFAHKYGPWAVVAGASEGLGAAFARALADRGLNLLLLARRADVLESVAAPLRARVEVRTAALDLGDPDLAARLDDLTRDLDVGLCVYNAALSRIGPFLDVPLADKLKIVDVNCRGPLLAAHVFGERLVSRGRGGLLLMSSLTAFWGSPLVATYGATKAFNLSLGEALWYELGPRGVDVLVCCAGATRTPGFERSSGPDGPRAMTPDAVVAEALHALGGPPSAVPGRLNRFAAFLLNRLFPRSGAVALMGSQTARLSKPST
ncbi:SDR family NAD(P)-dependent oxidoreductase [Nannocystis radixulma]|uniref:SDR family NAD(P)-dependent oxidoreductase n=1 Tax=Nannocystis radixulma TaxID=2995305 RepID=A0ABT5BMY3_9BACT|nr:SDR family NAD(P)-dependent oxidoreductase [Nannocystis radixulma]MDC0674362.1 SDR family NAD(P)-dependent oxidoreductase [Nannocystis radixulma]